jgi:hypothetical protein
MAGKLCFVSCTLFAWAAFGQTPAPQAGDQTFYLAHTDTRELQQIASLLRTVGDIRDVSVDESKAGLTVHGTAEQISMAGWLIAELDQVPAATTSSATHTYPGTISGGDVMHLYFLTGPQKPADLQEIVNSARSVADIQRFYPYVALRAIAARAKPDQVALADWLIGVLDGPAKPGTQVSRTYDGPGTHGTETTQVYFLANTQTPQAIQELVNSTRSISDVQRLFPYNATRALTLRASAEQVALADWLLQQLDRPAVQAKADSDLHEYQVPATVYRGTGVARVFYLGGEWEAKALQELTVAVRTETRISRAFPIFQVNALAVLGTGDQIARAEQIIKEHRQ